MVKEEIEFKDISYLKLRSPRCLAEWNHLYNFGKGHYFEFRPVALGEMTFKDISYLKLWWPFCSMHQNHLCNFGRGHH